MDWKSTAVISGAGILATYFFSMPAVHPPVPGTAAQIARPQQAPASAIDIQQEAARLEVRVRKDPEIVGTSRDPFRFGARPAAAAHPAGTSGPIAAAVPVMHRRPLRPPRITLGGIATDVVDGHEQRTAILHTDAGVVLVHGGRHRGGAVHGRKDRR